MKDVKETPMIIQSPVITKITVTAALLEMMLWSSKKTLNRLQRAVVDVGGGPPGPEQEDSSSAVAAQLSKNLP